MDNTHKQAENCHTMAEVRVGVDATDRQIMDLLLNRFAYMRAAARIKQDREEVRDETRKSAVIAAMVERTQAADLPAAEIGAIWDLLVEASIAYELAEWDRLRDHSVEG